MKIEAMETLRRPTLDLNDPIRRRAADSLVPLTDNQVDYWHYITRNGNRLTTRMRAAAVRILGPLDIGVLRTSIDAVVQRHESLRTRIVADNGIPSRQYILEMGNYPFEVIDLSTLSPQRTEEEAARLAREFFARTVDLCVEPLLAAALLRLSSSEHVLLLSLDHIVGDGVSCGILSKDIWASYHRIARRLPPSLPSLPVQFADYAVWEQQTYGARREKDEAFWAGRLAGAPRIQVPLDTRPAGSDTEVGDVVHLPLGKALSNALREVAQRERTLQPIAVLTVYLVAMSHWCDQADWPVLFVSHGRHRRAELQNMIGFLSRSLRFRIEVSKTASLIDLLRITHLQFASSADHQDFVPPLPAHLNFAQVFNWGGLTSYYASRSADSQRGADTEVRIQPYPVDWRDSHTFYLYFSDTSAGIVAIVHYRPDLIASATIERLGHNMRLVAGELHQRPLARIGSLSLV